MLSTNAWLWPQVAANSAEVEAADPFGIGTVFEAQARLWSHMLYANRSFWSSTRHGSRPHRRWNAALAPLGQEKEVRAEQSIRGVPDALEAQTRSRNFLDANRNFWTAFNWPMPATPWVNGASVTADASNDEPEAAPPHKTPTASGKGGSKRSRA
jgi:hypothetical protein